MKRNILLYLMFVLHSFAISAQTSPFNILLTPVSLPGLPGIQSYAVGQFNGKWLIAGGRLDGLHRRQPFAAFDLAGQQNNLIVVDPVSMQKWDAPLTSLPISIQEQLSSTNMEFYQQDSFLYCIGGYGYSNTAGDHITYNKLTAINVPLVIDAVINSNNFVPFFRQITDSQFAVTGGRLDKIYNTWYLVGGQKFDGRYNPMNMPTYTQEYTCQLRRFIINDNGTTISVSHLPYLTDTNNLHRRDYNVMPQIMPDGEEGLTAFSGVFQTTSNVPYLNCVDIDSAGFAVNNAFSQYYNHYHCANLSVYSASSNEMHNVFFGGIAQYYDSLNVLVQDNNVPFVKTIARVTRDGNGIMAEYKLPVEMPALLGAGSELIPVDGLPVYSNHVLKLDSLTSDTTLVGYILGGISSTASNIFFTNTGTQSNASDQLFKVFLIKNSSAGIHQLNTQSIGSLHLQVYPNPNDGKIIIKFDLSAKANVKLSISDMSGKIIKFETFDNLPLGENMLTYRFKKAGIRQVFNITVEAGSYKSTQKIIINP